jgi:hypothetical protein
MRKEIREPQHWRNSRHGMGNISQTSRSRSNLSADAVDAAFEEETSRVTPVRASRRDQPSPDRSDKELPNADIIQSLTHQLAMLESHCEQLHKLLEEAQS